MNQSFSKHCPSPEEIRLKTIENIETHGLSFIGILGQGIYTVGLTPRYNAEIIGPAWLIKAAQNIINQVFAYGSNKVIPEKFPEGTVFESEDFAINVKGEKQSMRYRFVRLEDNATKQELLERFAYSVTNFYPTTKDLYFVQVGDKNNILPGEEGYDFHMQSPEYTAYHILLIADNDNADITPGKAH